MTQNYIKDVMESMGWTDGSYIPIANEENKKYLELINGLIKQKHDRSSFLQTIASRHEKIILHHKNAEHDINQNLKIINAYRSQLTSENHMLKLSQHDDSRLRKQIQEVEKENIESKKYEEAVNNEIDKINKNVDQMSNKIEWAKNALSEWRNAMAKGEETNLLIEKYCKEDQGRADALENKRRILQDTISKQKAILINTYEEQKSLEQTLERTAQLYRQAHLERRHLVSTWKDAVNQMNQREGDIQSAEIELENAKKETTKRNQELKQHEHFLNEQILNNKEVEVIISGLNEEMSSLRKELNAIVDDVASRENEIIITRKQLQDICSKLQQRRQKNRQVLKDRQARETQIKDVESTVSELSERLKKFESRSMNAQERLKQLNEIVEGEERTKWQLTQEITRLDGLFFRSQQQLAKFKDEEKILTHHNRATETNINTIKSNFAEQEKELIRRIEIAYNLGFKLQQLELRIANVQGTIVNLDPEKETELMVLEEEKESKSKQLLLLQAQITKIEDDMRRLTLSYNYDSAEVEKMKDKIKEQHLLCDGGDKKLRDTIRSNQERIVELNVLKLKVHQMEKQIAKQENKAYNLEKHRIELESAMSERLIDIKTQTELLFIKRKHLQEERGTLKLEMNERLIKIEAAKKRYGLAVELLGKNEDGSFVTATQLKIEAAQEKQMLLQEGNELNEKVLKAEEDIKAMENTLCLLNYSNDAYRKTFEQLDEQNSELIEYEEQQKLFCKNVTRLKTIRNSLAIKAQEITDITNKLENLERDLDEIDRTRMESNEVLMKIHKELIDQKTKLQRAERELKCAYKLVRQKNLDEDFIRVFEKELDLKEIEEKNTTALQLLADLVEASSEISPSISKLLYEKGMKVPQSKRLRTQSSFRSDTSEHSFGESSMKIFSTSSKGSVCSSVSSKVKTVGSAQPSVISIDFPDGDNARKPPTKRSTKSTAKLQ